MDNDQPFQLFWYYENFIYLATYFIITATLLKPEIIKRSKHSVKFNNSYQVKYVID